MSLSQQDPLPSTVPLLPACPGCVYPQRGRDLCGTSLTEDRSLPNLLIGFSFPFEQELRIRWPRRAFTTKTIPRFAPLGGSPASPRGQPRPGCALREHPRHPCAASLPGAREGADGQEGAQGLPGDTAATLQPRLSVPCVPVPLDVLVGKALVLPAGTSGTAGNSGNREWSPGHLCLSTPLWLFHSHISHGQHPWMRESSEEPRRGQPGMAQPRDAPEPARVPADPEL